MDVDQTGALDEPAGSSRWQRGEEVGDGLRRMSTACFGHKVIDRLYPLMQYLRCLLPTLTGELLGGLCDDARYQLLFG